MMYVLKILVTCYKYIIRLDFLKSYNHIRIGLMVDNSLNKEWKQEFYKIFATEYDNINKLEEADKLKFEHFPPVIGNFYTKVIDIDALKNICNGKLFLSKAKLDDNYNENILEVDYVKTIKGQLNVLMQQQMAKLYQEDPNFLSDEEKEIIESSDFPFIRLMTLVYVKDTDEMTHDEQEQWKGYMNDFINQQITFGVINTYYTMKLYQDNNYVRSFQTPYNKEGVWEEYANDKKGFCVTYDFKEISEKTALQLNRLFPVLYVDHKLTSDELDFKVYNAHCASLLKIKDEIHEYDNEWMYIFNHHFTEGEYKMLDNLLEPVYTKTTNHESIQEIMKNKYLITRDDDLEYDYQKIIGDLLDVLESQKLQEEIKPLLNDVYKITDDTMEIDFLKPEAIYLGTKFPEDKIEEYKEVIEGENVRIFKIKETDDGRLFKSLI